MISNFDNLMQQYIDFPTYGRADQINGTNNAITAITQTNPMVATISANRTGFRSNTSIDYYGYIKGATGCDAVNGIHYSLDKKRQFWHGTMPTTTKMCQGYEWFGSIIACGHARANSTTYTAATSGTATAASYVSIQTNDTNWHVYLCTTSGTTAAAQGALYPGISAEVITDGNAVFTEVYNTLTINCADKVVFGNYRHGMSAGKKFCVNISAWSGAFNASEGGAPAGTNGIKTPTDIINVNAFTLAYDAIAAGEPHSSGGTIVTNLVDSSGMPAWMGGGNILYLPGSETDIPAYDGAHFYYTWTDYYNLDWSLWTAADLWGRPTYKDLARTVTWMLYIEKNGANFSGNSTSLAKTNGIPNQWLTASISENAVADWDVPMGVTRPMAGTIANQRFIHGALLTDVFTSAQQKAVAFEVICSTYYNEASFLQAGNIGETTLKGVTKYSDMTGHGSVNTSVMPSGDANSPSWANTREAAYQLIGNVYFERAGGARITDSSPNAGWVRAKEFTKFLHDSCDFMRTRTFPETGIQQGRQRMSPFFQVIVAWALIESRDWEVTRPGGNFNTLWSYAEPTLSFVDWVYQHWDWMHNTATPAEINASNFHFTAVVSSSTTVGLDASASAVTGTYVDSYIRHDASQTIYYISAYDGPTKTVTIAARSTGGDGRAPTPGTFSTIPVTSDTLTIGNPPNIVTETGKVRVIGPDGRVDMLYESQFNGTLGDAPYAFWGNGTVYRGLNIMQSFIWAWLANEYKLSNSARATICATNCDAYFNSCVFDYNGADITTSGQSATVSYAKNFNQVFFFGLKARALRLQASV